ncbi:hypothetical protein Prudu_003631 [Prunus dulcis]|uniref:Uncharacterized protein n=1 Tax=Prunus dulcis TaxID=3755 RepID=A0A4Y1QTN2_PRUDU|nr:hypothetical protein Prudu_003631 [Prunus dulcis]
MNWHGMAWVQEQLKDDQLSVSEITARTQTRGYCASVHKSYFGSSDQKTSLMKVYTSLAQQGRVPKACVVSIVAGSFECTISQLGNLDFYLDFSVESISRVAEDTLPTPPLGTSSVAADTALHLPAAQPPAHPFISTSDTTAGTSPQLPAVLPPTLLS